MWVSVFLPARRRLGVNYLAADGEVPRGHCWSSFLKPTHPPFIALNFFFGQFELFNRGTAWVSGVRGPRGRNDQRSDVAPTTYFKVGVDYFSTRVVHY